MGSNDHPINTMQYNVARMEEGRSAFKILIVKPAGKRPLGRPRPRLERNIIMEIGIGTRNWIDSAQDKRLL